MSKASSLIKKISKAIQRVGPMSRTSYKRIITRTGGDELIGRSGTTVSVDTVFIPQPVYRQLGHRQAMFLSTSTLQLVSDDFHFTFPVTQVSQEDFEGADTYLVLKDANGEERFRILYISSYDYAGSNVALSVFARSMGHVSGGYGASPYGIYPFGGGT